MKNKGTKMEGGQQKALDAGPTSFLIWEREKEDLKEMQSNLEHVLEMGR